MMSDIETLFRRYRDRVYRWAYALCGRHADAADICQEVFIRTLVRQPRLDGEAACRGWLRRVATTIAIDRWRAQRSGRVEPDAVESGGFSERADERAAAQETAERLRSALEQISEQQRLVLIAKEFDDRTFAEIAEELGIAVSTVKTHYVRALEALRRELGEKPAADRAAPPRKVSV